MGTITSINLNAGTSPIAPVGGAITAQGASVAAGTVPVQTYGTGASTFQTQVQISQAIASSNATNIGLAAFNSGQFTVDANGFVSLIGGGFIWVNVVASTQTIVASHGYIIDNGGLVTLTLPASSTLGDVFRITGLTGSWQLAQNASQQILFGSKATTSGTGGYLASTNAGNCVELVAVNTSSSSVWRVMSVQGNVTVV